MHNKKATRVIALILAGLLLTACSSKKEDAAAAEEWEQVLKVDAQKPFVEDISTNANFIGTVQAESTVYVVPMVSGEVTEKHFEIGDHVNEGDLLFKIDDAAAQIALSQANAALSQANAGVNQAKAGLEAQQASLTMTIASNAATMDAATESMGKLETGSYAMKMQADAAANTAATAGIGIDSAQAQADYYDHTVQSLIDKRDSLKKALKGATDPTIQSELKTQIQSLESSIDQMALQRDVANNTVSSGEINYRSAAENAEYARLQQRDYEVYTKPASTTAIGAQIISSEEQIKAQEAQIKASQATITSGNAAVSQASAAVKNAQMALDYTVVTAPVSGTITQINVSEHNLAAQGQAAYTIQSDAQSKIVFYAAEKTAREMVIGNDALVTKNGSEYAAKITSISSTVDAATGLFKIEAQLNDPSVSFVYGSNVSLNTPIRQSKGALTLPIDAVYYDGAQAFVYVSDNGTAKKVDVETGLSDEDTVEITTGLTASDIVITSWSSQLKEGSAVTIN